MLIIIQIMYLGKFTIIHEVLAASSMLNVFSSCDIYNYIYIYVFLYFIFYIYIFIFMHFLHSWSLILKPSSATQTDFAK